MSVMGGSEFFDVDMPTDMSIDSLARCVISRCLILDSMGLSSYAADMALAGVQRCCVDTSTSETSAAVHPDVLALMELSVQLHHFSGALYAGFLNPEASLVEDWLGCSISNNIMNIFQSWVLMRDSSADATSPPPISILEVIVDYIRPMSEGPFCLFQSSSCDELFDRLIGSLQSDSMNYDDKSISECLRKSLLKRKAQGADSILEKLIDQSIRKSSAPTEASTAVAESLLEDSFERAIVSSLGEIVKRSKGCLKGLQTVLDVAVASVPTLRRNQRCIRSPMRLASLVVTACCSFNNTYTSASVSLAATDSQRESLPLMWLLIETTPASLEAFDIEGMNKESATITFQLDAIQAALAVCEVVQCYLISPPLFLLLADHDDSNLRRCDSGYIRQARRTYIRDLLSGCSFLIANMGASAAESAVEDDSDRSPLPTASNVEVLSNTVSMGQALILRLTFEHGLKQESMSRSKSSSNESSNSSWAVAAGDVEHLYAYFTARSVPPPWVGHAFLQCMMHFKGLDKDFEHVLATILNTESRSTISRSVSVDKSEESSGTLGPILKNFGLQSVDMERIVLKRAIEIFNSVSSCSSNDLQEAEHLLALLPQQSSSPTVAAGVRLERNLMEVVRLLSDMQVDLLPLQLRLLKPADVASKLLKQRPEAYYEVNGTGDFEDLYRVQARGDGDKDGDGDKQDFLLRRTLLRDRSPPGARLVRVLSALHTENPESCVTATLHTVTAEIRLELLFAAISVEDMEGAYCLCRALLTASATSTGDDVVNYKSSLPPAVLQRISESALLVVGMLDCADATSSVLCKALRCDLLSLILASTPVAELDRFSPLWKVHQSASTVSHISAAVTGEDASADSVHIAAAQTALLDTIAKVIRRSDSSDTYPTSFKLSAAEMVTSAGTDNSRLSDVMGHLLLVKDHDKVHNLIEKLYADLDKKLSATLMRERQGQSSSTGRSSSSKLDDALVDRVASKGFSRNSAKRAVLATRGIGFQEALAWAVEHSRDEDFEFPIAEAVKGALLSESDKDGFSLNPESVKGALKVIADVSEMYQHNCTAVAAHAPSLVPSLLVESTPMIAPDAGHSDAVMLSVNASQSMPEQADEVAPYEAVEDTLAAVENVVEQVVEPAAEEEVELEVETEEVIEKVVERPVEVIAVEVTAAIPSSPLVAPPSTALRNLPPPPVSREVKAAMSQTATLSSPPAPQSRPSLPETVETVKPLHLVTASSTSAFSVPKASVTLSLPLSLPLPLPLSSLVKQEDSPVQQPASVEVFKVDSPVAKMIDLGDVPNADAVAADEVLEVLTKHSDPFSGPEPDPFDDLSVSDVESLAGDQKNEDLRSELSDIGAFSALNPSMSDDKAFEEDLSSSEYVHVEHSLDLPPAIDAPPSPVKEPTVTFIAPPIAAPSLLPQVSVAVAPVHSLPALPPPPTRPVTRLSMAKDAEKAMESDSAVAVPLVPTLKPIDTSSLPRLSPIPSSSTNANTSSNTVMKAHLVSRLRNVLDVAEDFTGTGIHTADLARSVANKEPGSAWAGEEEIGGACDQVFQACRSLATHRRAAAFEFLPQLLALLPAPFLTDTAIRAERLIFQDTSDTTTPAEEEKGKELERATWALAALRLVVYHTGADPAVYAVCTPVLYLAPSTYKTVKLLMQLYEGLEGSNQAALIGVKMMAAEHLTSTLAADSAAYAACVSDAARAIEGLQQSSSISRETDVASALATVTASFKQLQDDVAVLRRVGRIPDSVGVDAKALLGLPSGDLYRVSRKDPFVSPDEDADIKKRFRQQAVLAMGPYLYSQTITHWVKVVGRQLGWSSADFSYQYACCILSATAAKSHLRSVDHADADEGVDGWALLSTELSSCVRRMKPEHTRALCLIVGGASIPDTPGYLGCEMLFPLGPVPDLGAASIIGAIHAAVLKLANTATVGTPVTSPLLSASSPFTLSPLQARDLLDSIAYVKDFIAAVHTSLPPLSSARKALMSCCLDSREKVPSELVSMMCSPMGKDKAVVRIGTAWTQMRDVDECRGAESTLPNEAVKMKEKELEQGIIRGSIDLIANLIRPSAAKGAAVGRAEGSSTDALNAFSASNCLIANAHTNYGLSLIEGIARELCALTVSLSSTPASSSTSPSTSSSLCVCVEDRKYVCPSLDITDRCIAAADVCKSYLSNVCNSLPEDQVILQLKEFMLTIGTPTQDLLTTRRVLCQIYSFSPSSPGPATHEVEIINRNLHAQEGAERGHGSNTVKMKYSLDNNDDKTSLFEYLTAAVTALPAVHATVAVRSLVRLLRCWGLSRAGGSLKRALESPLPQGTGFLSSILLEPLEASFRMTCWSAVMPLLEREDLFIDILNIIIVDLQGSPDVMSDIIIPLVKNSRMPKNVQQAIGILIGGESARQAVGDLERSITALPSSDFSVPLMAVLLSLADKEVVQAVVKSHSLLARLVQYTSRNMKARLLTAHHSASEQHKHAGHSNDFSTLSDFITAYPDGSLALNVPSAPQGSSGVRSGHDVRSDVIPMILSPSYLAVLLITGGFFAQAAHFHWMTVIKRPAGMYTPNAAVSLLLHHLSHCTLPFYLSHPAAPQEVIEQLWGWGGWSQLCRQALNRD